MKVIDVHTHIFPPKIEDQAVKAISDFYDGARMRHHGTPEELIASGSKIGVERYLVFSAATISRQVESINSFIISQCEKYPQFMGAGTMHKDYDGVEAEIDRLYKSGIYGVKLHPDFQQFNVDDAKLDDTYRALTERGMFMIAHTGDDRYDFSHPDRMANVARRFPKLRIIAAHFGGLCQWRAARRNLLTLPNVYIDTSSTLGFGAYDEAKEILKMFDKKHIFFATDFPMWDHVEELERVQKLRLDSATMEDILYNNFNAFYDY